jgi:hypothetical protein
VSEIVGGAIIAAFLVGIVPLALNLHPKRLAVPSIAALAYLLWLSVQITHRAAGAVLDNVATFVLVMCAVFTVAYLILAITCAMGDEATKEEDASTKEESGVWRGIGGMGEPED